VRGECGKREPRISDDESSDASLLTAHRLIVPVEGVRRASLRDNFDESRGGAKHEALDIAAPRGRRSWPSATGEWSSCSTADPGA
jgi:hypothetical protein